MKSTQNKKIQQVKETTLMVGIDVGSENIISELSTGGELNLQRSRSLFRIPWWDLMHSMKKWHE